MSELGPKSYITEDWSGEHSKQKQTNKPKQRLAKLGGKRKRVLFEELEVW